MTNITPQQMRELAAEHEAQFKQFDDYLSSTVSTGRTRRTIEALRTAADQLDAVRQWATEFDYAVDPWVDLDTILTADTAPQEDRDE